MQVGSGAPVRLTKLELRLLQMLIANAGHTVSSDRLLMHVWGHRGAGDRQLLKQLVHRLRQKIERDPAESAAAADDRRRRLQADRRLSAAAFRTAVVLPRAIPHAPRVYSSTRRACALQCWRVRRYMPGTRFTLEVQPRIPARLARLEALADDLYYSWDHAVRSLFFRLIASSGNRADTTRRSSCAASPRRSSRRPPTTASTCRTTTASCPPTTPISRSRASPASSAISIRRRT